MNDMNEEPENEMAEDAYLDALADDNMDELADATQIMDECLDRLMERGYHCVMAIASFDPLSGDTVQAVSSRGNRVLQRGIVETMRDYLISSNSFMAPDA